MLLSHSETRLPRTAGTLDYRYQTKSYMIEAMRKDERVVFVHASQEVS
jgi:hypothetical protein